MRAIHPLTNALRQPVHGGEVTCAPRRARQIVQHVGGDKPNSVYEDPKGRPGVSAERHDSDVPFGQPPVLLEARGGWPWDLDAAYGSMVTATVRMTLQRSWWVQDG